jgi:hypothetical protein
VSENAFIHKELFRLFANERIGGGMSREAWASKLMPNWVIKTEEHSQHFQNVLEWQTWQEVKGTPFAKWFAPCVQISSCGGVLVMERTTRPAPDQFPELMPAFLTDFKRANYGMIGGQIVCHDYGTNRLMVTGMTKRMVKANWWD